MSKKINYEGREVEVIDLTPTWSDILPALLLVLRDGNEQGKAIATGELVRMAEIADKYNELVKENKG